MMNIIVGDIGGTNARFARLDEHGQPVDIQKLKCADYAGPEAALEHYLQLIGAREMHKVCIDVAGPVSGDRIKLTNNHWDFSIQAVETRFALQRFLVINDFDALARSLTYLTPSELSPLIPGTPEPFGTRALIGPGTGLGTAGLLWSGEKWLVIAGEGGYASLPVRTDREVDAWRVLRNKHGRVSAERVLSGQGLVALYQALCSLERQTPRLLEPAEIVACALQGNDALCHETLSIFCALLGDVTGNHALTLGARGGVYLGGGIPPQIVDFLRQSDFSKRYLDRGRISDYIKTMPVFVITADTPALRGCADAILAE